MSSSSSSAAAVTSGKPRGDHRPLTLNPTGAYDKVPADYLHDEQQAESQLVSCATCGRKFREDRLEKHQTACSKLQDGSSRRGAFNTSTTSKR